MRCSACIAVISTAYTAYAQTPLSTETLVQKAAQIAHQLRTTFPDSNLALVPQPFWWWQSGIVTNALLTYGFVTHDTQYLELTKNTLLSQATPANDFMTGFASGNDDQAWWALSALTGAENNVPEPADAPTFLSLAQNVFNEQKARWDTATCGGGMQFKVNPALGERGAGYKSTIANGLFFQLAARLGKFTGDAEALAWAEKSYDWVTSVGFIDGEFNVHDGVDDGTACKEVNQDMWSYNVGAFLYGAAVMSQQSGEAKWRERTQGLLGATKRNFVRDGELRETLCEGPEARQPCSLDQVSFKGILARWLGATAVVMPELKDDIAAVLEGAAEVAQSRWTVGMTAMEHYVALETVNAAVKVRGDAAPADGMIGADSSFSGPDSASRNLAKAPVKRSVAGRVVWEQ
ncbi:glycoside hydrolase [Bimuria novae-zelandiae CBS 107.79]|uniref:mannan endo-1,6-alpha-mannosidase n=1 Tax=Bimuria novae-zelandiae CBS 107.79 TaxID=1447943 RepID=A0A6A5VPP4_9PLEO|nr:glycoside hydrolase [Bimuria novae-zelandiae CBS 107.79]